MSIEQRVSRLEQIVQLQEDKRVLRDWLSYCLRQEDWHGVMDAAADIREIEAKVEALSGITLEARVETQKSFCSDCDCGKAEGCGS